MFDLRKKPFILILWIGCGVAGKLIPRGPHLSLGAALSNRVLSPFSARRYSNKPDNIICARRFKFLQPELPYRQEVRHIIEYHPKGKFSELRGVNFGIGAQSPEGLQVPLNDLGDIAEAEKYQPLINRLKSGLYVYTLDGLETFVWVGVGMKRLVLPAINVVMHPKDDRMLCIQVIDPKKDRITTGVALCVVIFRLDNNGDFVVKYSDKSFDTEEMFWLILALLKAGNEE